MDVDQAYELLQTAGGDPLQVAKACEVIKAWADARQLGAIQQLSEELPEGYDQHGELVDPVPAELACYLSWTPWAASARVDLTHDLHQNLPGLLQDLGDGLLDLAKVQEIARASCGLNPADRVGLADRAAIYASSHTRGQLRAWIARQIVKIDPDAAEKRRKKEVKKRRVWIQPETDGMATLGAYLTAEEAQACYESLHAGVAGHEGSIDGARADLLVQRLTGLTPAEPIPVQVLITPTGPEIAGYGPISPAHADQLCDSAPKITLNRPAPTLSYAPTISLKRYVRARDRHCRFPGCRRPAIQCDTDHILEHPWGPTDEANLHCLCRRHHRLKTFTDWTVIRHPDGTETWTSPRGHRYSTRPDDP